MLPKSCLFILPTLALIAAGVLWFKEVMILRLENKDRCQIANIVVTPSSKFTLSYIHSIYLAPVTEEFEVGDGGEIILRGVRTKSPRVAEYYGFEDVNKEYYPMNRRMKSFSLRIGMATTQKICYESRSLSLQEIGDKGDQLEVGLVQMTLAHYLLYLIKKGN